MTWLSLLHFFFFSSVFSLEAATYLPTYLPTYVQTDRPRERERRWLRLFGRHESFFFLLFFFLISIISFIV